MNLRQFLHPIWKCFLLPLVLASVGILLMFGLIALFGQQKVDLSVETFYRVAGQSFVPLMLIVIVLALLMVLVNSIKRILPADTKYKAKRAGVFIARLFPIVLGGFICHAWVTEHKSLVIINAILIAVAQIEEYQRYKKQQEKQNVSAHTTTQA